MQPLRNPHFCVTFRSYIYFVATNKLSLNFKWKGKKPRWANKIFEKNKIKGLTTSNIKIFCKAKIIKIAWYQNRTDILINGLG